MDQVSQYAALADWIYRRDPNDQAVGLPDINTNYGAHELRCQFTKYIQFRYTSHSSHDGVRLRWWKLRMCNSAKGSEEFF